MKGKLLFIIFFIFFLTGITNSFATNFYVDNQATGNNTGLSWNDAWESFFNINWSLIQPGDFIYISGGSISKTYYEYILIPEGISGTQGSPITITKGTDPGHDGTVILDGINIPDSPAVWIENSGYITVSHLNLQRWLCEPLNRGTIGIFDSHHIIIEYNTILGWSQGVKIDGSNNCIIRHNSYTTPDFIDNQTDGIYASENTDNIYEWNYINISNSDDDHNDCFQGQEEGPCIIRYNYMIHTGGSALKPVDSQGIFDKYAHGLHQYINNFIYLPNTSTSTQQMNDGILEQQNPVNGGEPASVICLNNTIVGASTHTLGIEAYDAVVKNNLIILLDEIALARYPNIQDKSQVDYNLYFKNGTTGNSVINGYSNLADWQSAGGDIHGLNVDPQLGPDFLTLPNTPPVEAGTDLTSYGVLFDLEGVQRPQGAEFDIGAYEVYLGPDLIPPELESAELINSTTLNLTFSEPLDESTAENESNYSIPGITVLNAVLNGLIVTLTTTEHTAGFYTVTVSGVTDLSGNLISPLYNSASYNYEPDLIAPEVTGAAAVSFTKVIVSFSEEIEETGAENPDNYSIDNNITINSAVLSDDGKTVALNTSEHQTSVTYTLTVNNVTDLAGNLISASANSAQYVGYDPGQIMMLDIISAEASSVPEPEHSPDKAIDGLAYFDGDPDSRWAADNMPQWIQFDLGQVSSISRAVISFFYWNHERIYNFDLLVSSDLNNWETILDDFSSSLSEEWNVLDFDPVDARYLRVLFNYNNQNDWAGMWEIQIWGITLPTNSETSEIPQQYLLRQNYPNPFNPSTTIEFDLPVKSGVRLSIYNALGEEVYLLAEGEFSAGNHKLSFDAQNLPSGVYFYTIETPAFRQTRKMLLIR